ncbi:MAG TPA: gliding motility-associated C-terminal domain-containing protein [Saprospiraceae bacterium]|nr:gliding motility-associated C-terminal domain-containing protein [Saprospiraceae bacterium]HMQ81869.1 gliding motility-associated C-terminal domain-containing protein [Saprospiraceae bacterium]
MKKILILLIAVMGVGLAAYAQPTINIVPPDGDPPCTGETVCVQVVVEDFTDILSTRFILQWDSTVLQFNNVQNVNLPGLNPTLGAGNFSLLNSGQLFTEWFFAICQNNPSAPGYTITDDGTAIFDVCFTTLGAYGAATQIIIPQTAVPLTPDIRRSNTSCTNIGINLEAVDTAVVSTCVRPFILYGSEEFGNEGDLVCIDFAVTGFDELNSFQFTLAWDPALADFESIIVPPTLPNLGGLGASFFNPGPGLLTTSWSYVDVGNGTITLPDSSIIFQVCLRLRSGSCDEVFDVFVTDEPTPIEVSNNFSGGFNDLFFQPRPGEVTVGPCAPTGLQLIADCGDPVDLNDPVCVEVSVGTNFQSVDELAFQMEFNPNILTFTGANALALTGIDFNTANVGNGILGLEWDNGPMPPLSLANGTAIFEVCFTVDGLNGNGPFQFVSNGAVAISNNTNIGINPSNCDVQINQPEGVVINITDDLEGRPGDILLFDFVINNFTEVESMQFSIAFEPTELQLVLPGGITNINLPGASIANFGLLGIGGGVITFSWNPSSAVTLPDGTIAFTLSFEIVGDPGDCGEVLITNDPLEAEVITSSSNGNNIGLTSTGGGFCILSPEGFYLEVVDAEGDLLDTICVDFKVSDFDNITSANFCVNWNPGNLSFVSLNDNGFLPGLVADVSDEPVGLACFDWTGSPAGLALPDSTVILEICFELLGPGDDCYPITISENPMPTVSTTNGDGSLLDIPGEVCINNKLFIVDTIITPESCPGAADGKIKLVIEGGVEPYIFSWGTAPPQFTDSVRFLSAGTYFVTILDSSGPPLVLETSFEIGALGGDLIANAGPDRIAGCSDVICDLINPTTSSGPNISYMWTAIQGGQICSSPNDEILLAKGPGTFILTVMDNDIGCFVQDTVLLLEPDYPEIDTLFTTQEITCDVPMVQINATATQDLVSYTWTTQDGAIVPGDEDALSPQVTAPGVYYLEVEYLTTNCAVLDSIEVIADTVVPLAVASPATDTTALGCNDVAILEGFAGDDITGYTFEWRDEDGNVLTTNQDYTTNTAGTYFFYVLDTENGCDSLDSTIVVQDDEVPVIEITGLNGSTDFVCNSTQVELEANISNIEPGAASLNWVASNGGQLLPGTENLDVAVVTAAGTFELFVTNQMNDCQTSVIINVGYDTLAPMIVLDTAAYITCLAETVLLDATGTEEGQDYTYEWFYTELNELAGEGLAIEVGEGAPGIYAFTVTDTISGCTNTAEINVVLDTLPPVINVAGASTFTCDLDTITLITTVEGLETGEFSVAWEQLEGTPGIASGANEATTVIIEPGLYFATVTSNLSGCSDTLSRQIEIADDVPVIVLDGDMLFIDCNSPTDTISALGSTPNTSLTIQYEWTQIEGTNGIAGPIDEDFFVAGGEGTFVFTITNTESNCAVSDTVVAVANFDTPELNMGESFLLDCNNQMGQINASLSSPPPGGDITYTWTDSDGNIIATDVTMISVTQPDLYTLEIVNENNGCSDIGSVNIGVDGDVPQIVFSDNTMAGEIDYTCLTDTLEVSFSILNDTLFTIEALDFTWTGDVIIEQDSFTVMVTEPGVYNIMIVNTLTGCTGENDLVVSDARTEPEAMAVASDITCIETTSMLDGAGSTLDTMMNGTITYQWFDVDGSPLGTALQQEVTVAGTYSFAILNTVNGCTSDTIAVEVLENTAPPAINFATPESFQCSSTTVLLDASGSGDPNDLTPVWESLGGALIEPVAGTLTANASGPGLYQLTLTSNTNGCDSIATIEILADTAAIEVLLTETPDQFGCEGQTVSIDVSATGVESDFESIVWSSSGAGTVDPPSGSFVVAVDAAGTYSVTVTDENGCQGSETFLVEEDPNQPDANVSVVDDMLGCGETLTLDGSASSTGDVYMYEWVVVAGGPDLPSPSDGLTPTIDAVGTYQLIVTNIENFCADSASVQIQLDDSLEQAAAGADFSVCGDAASLNANLPQGATGEWVSLGSATLSATDTPNTDVAGLDVNGSEFIWILSLPGCPAYSADTITVTPEATPDAFDDMISLNEQQTFNTHDVTINDDLFNVSEWEITVQGVPAFGQVTTESNGSLTYTLNIALLSPATDQYTYQICNAACLEQGIELCDEATVQITIVRDSTGQFNTPSGITPNGDNVNETFIFDELLLNPDEYKDNELIIFNRWGDIVFQAKPYNNDWSGKNMDGETLPDGTYYYILRLNIGDGEIIRGDVTILR